MENSTIVYTSCVNPSDEALIGKVISNNPDYELRSNLQKQQLFELVKTKKLKHLIIGFNDSAIQTLDFILENRGYFLTCNILFVVADKNDETKLPPAKYLECFERSVYAETNGGLIEFASSFAELLSAEESQSSSSLYIPLDSQIFSNFKNSPCDIFIKLSDVKYVKILSLDDEQNPKQVIAKYTEKGVKELYIQVKDLNCFKEYFKEKLFTIDPNAPVVEQKLQIAESVMAVASDFGVSEFLIEGINSTFSEISDELNNDKKLKDILKNLKDAEGSVLSNHSYLTAIFATLICSKMSWATSNIKKNLSLASILHDVDLVNSPHLNYEFKSLEEINQLDQKSATKFKNHGQKLADQLTKNSSIPTDVINLIAKHHEGSKTDSYPQGILGGQLSPPNCLFNVAHRFSIELSKIAFNYQKVDVAIAKLREYYAGGAMFVTFINILEKELSTKKN